MNDHESLNYLELPARDLAATKTFFKDVFMWTFIDYSDSYTTFSTGKIDGGFYQSNLHSSTASGAVLIVFFSRDLKATEQKILDAGGEITKDTYQFPGGKRFHFADPSGNEFAVWSKT